MTWVVIARIALDRWEATTPVGRDANLRLTVVEWLHALQVSDPPEDGIFDASRDTLFAQVPGTPIWIEYLALPYLSPPAIVIRQLHH